MELCSIERTQAAVKPCNCSVVILKARFSAVALDIARRRFRACSSNVTASIKTSACAVTVMKAFICSANLRVVTTPQVGADVVAENRRVRHLAQLKRDTSKCVHKHVYDRLCDTDAAIASECVLSEANNIVRENDLGTRKEADSRIFQTEGKLR